MCGAGMQLSITQSPCVLLIHLVEVQQQQQHRAEQRPESCIINMQISHPLYNLRDAVSEGCCQAFFHAAVVVGGCLVFSIMRMHIPCLPVQPGLLAAVGACCCSSALQGGGTATGTDGSQSVACSGGISLQQQAIYCCSPRC